MLRRVAMLLLFVLPSTALLIGGVYTLGEDAQLALLAESVLAALGVLLIYGVPGGVALSLAHSFVMDRSPHRSVGRSVALGLVLGLVVGGITALVLVPPIRAYAVLSGAFAGTLYGVIVSYWGWENSERGA